jgi:hypothetical protein
MLLVAQYAQRHGVRALGFVAPALYGIAARRGASTAFHDITVGGNRHYPATDGWDFATGLGSPDVLGLARDMVTHLRGSGPRG